MSSNNNLSNIDSSKPYVNYINELHDLLYFKIEEHENYKNRVKSKLKE